MAWSPRELTREFNRTGPSLSPHPLMLPSDVPSFRSPEYRPSLSPRMHYNHDPGRISPGLSVPMLGGERGPYAHSPPSPMWRERSPQYSPRSTHETMHPDPEREFLPPPPPPPHRRNPEYMYASPNRFQSPKRYPDPAESHMQYPGESYEQQRAEPGEPYGESRERQPQEYQDESPERQSQDYHPDRPTSAEPMIPQRHSSSQSTPSPPVDVKVEESFDSPSAVADLDRVELTPPPDDGIEMSLELQRSEDSDDFPFDEENPAVDDAILMSPLPYDGPEDPTTLLEIPADLLKGPISPVGPQDDSL